MTKKGLLLISLALLMVDVASIFSRQIHICPSYSYSSCANFFDDFFIVLSPIIPFFIFSIVTYPMRNEVYREWWKLVRVSAPLSMLAILISPSNTHNWMFPIEKSTVAALSFLTFIISSILVIIFKYSSLKKKYNYSTCTSYAILLFSLIVAFEIMITVARML